MLWYLLHQAEASLKVGMIEEALSLYKTILEKAPEFPVAAHQLDQLLLEHVEPLQQLQEWESLHEEQKEALIPVLHYACALFDRDQTDQAIHLLEEFFQFRKKSPAVRTEYTVDTAAEKGVTLILEKLQYCADESEKAGHEELADFLHEKMRCRLSDESNTGLSLSHWIQALKE
ncbi:MAG: hypothetical protein GX130_07725 [Candidatus Hydrogenedens sp.]|jgi:tetratricopeptide (TPR) repeat protein|nr:hypothetical protein [Candidatus Hydrogenedens sp.]